MLEQVRRLQLAPSCLLVTLLAILLLVRLLSPFFTHYLITNPSSLPLRTAFFFFKQEAPRYPTGFLISLCILLAGIFLTVVYFFLCRWENSKRDKEEREKPKGELIDPDLAYRDLTDVENRGEF